MIRRKIGNFYIVEQIGAGGMSNVYLALNPRTREKRAVKVLARRATSFGTSYLRFQREIEIIRSLSHPNIVKIFESGVLEDCYFYSMEYMQAGSLARRVEHARFLPDQALEVFAPICRAMAFAHEKGIVHRDLKPANILMDSDGQPRVSDFGIAKVLDCGDADLTKSNEVMGSMAYLAPEQRFNSKRVDRRADVYALGAVLYEMVMGFPPLGKFPWPSETQPDFPAAVQDVISKCIALRPDDRFQDAGCLSAELEKYPGQRQSRNAAPVSARSGHAGASEEYPHNRDRIENWLQALRAGTTRERLAAVREMVECMDGREAKAFLKLYAGESDRVRWGLMRVFGERRIPEAMQLILPELKNPYQRECAIEALGRIGDEEAFNPIRRFLQENPNSASMALLPLARTGKQRAVKYLRPYLRNDMSILRDAAAQALAAVGTQECLQLLQQRLRDERDERVRAALREAIRSIDSCARSGCATVTVVRHTTG